jgi:hypothetical protein
MRHKKRLNRGQDQGRQRDQHESRNRADPDCNAQSGGQQQQSGQPQAIASLIYKFDHGTEATSNLLRRIT